MALSLSPNVISADVLAPAKVVVPVAVRSVVVVKPVTVTPPDVVTSFALSAYDSVPAAVLPPIALMIVSRLSKSVLIFVPHVSSDAPTSGFVKPYAVVVVSAMSFSYAASAQVSLEADAGVQSVDVGDTAAQLSGVLPASCHVLLFSATGVHVSGVSGSGSHFLRPFATTDAAHTITDAAFCTRLHVALTVATQAAVALSSNIATALAVVDACTAIAAAPSRTFRPDAATDAAANMEAEPICTRSAAAVKLADAAIVADASLTRVADAANVAAAAMVALPSRTRSAADAVVVTVSMIDAAPRTRTDAAAVADVTATMEAAPIIAPSKP